MKSSNTTQQLRKWLAILMVFCLISISADAKPKVSAQTDQPEFGGSGSIPDDLVSSNGYFPFKYELLKQTTTIWQDGRGVMVTERILRNVGSVSGDRAYWSFNWGPDVYSNIKAWDAQGPLQVLVDEYSTGIATTVVFRYPVQPNQTYNFFLSVTIDEFAGVNNGLGYASWYTNPGGVVRQYNSGTIIKWKSGIQNIQPAPSYQSGDFLEWRYANTTSTFRDSVSISYTFNKPPLILVHGFMGLDTSGGYRCSDGVVQYVRNGNVSNSTLPRNFSPALADWFTNLGYEVWIAHLETSPAHTDTLEQNAKCLKNQIAYVAIENSLPITIVAHSMGGVVSRAAIQKLDPSIKVESLYTLGSPHAGLPTDVIIALLGAIGAPMGTSGIALPATACAWQAGACDMSVTNMASSFNMVYKNKKGINYNFIGGDGGDGFLHKLLYLTLQGPNDGLIGQYSAVGWVYPFHTFLPSSWASPSLPGQYFTNETHPARSNPVKAYYLEQDGQYFSDSFGCMKALLIRNDPESQYCWDAETSGQSAQQNDGTTLAEPHIVFSEFHSGQLNASGYTEIPLLIDSPNSTMFVLNWVGGGALSFSLAPPTGGDDITPGNLPAGATFETSEGGPESPAHAIYSFPATEVGTWTLKITTSDAIDYQVYAIMDSPRVLKIASDKTTYNIGEIATFTVTVTSSDIGVPGATVTGKVSRPDNTVDTVIFIDQGSGIYSTNYTIPSNPGDFTITVNASGNDNGVAFKRETSLLFSVASDNLQLALPPTDVSPRDDNNDGLFEFLDLILDLSLTNPGSYTINADLFAGEQFITSAGNYFDLTAGSHSITLTFDGVTIRESGVNGPYTIKNLNVISAETGVNDQRAETVSTTADYLFTQFGGIDTCYELTLDHFGSGANPVVSPSNSEGCGPGEFVSGETITLTAFPGTGWLIDGWTGTSYDVSQSAVNVLEMPASPQNVMVTYKQIPATIIIRAILSSNGAQDGWVRESSENSEIGGTVDSTAPILIVGDDALDRQYCSILSFDTSSLPDTAVITQATLAIRVNAILGGGNPLKMFNYYMADVINGSFGASSLAASDFQASPTVTAGPLGQTNPGGGWLYIGLSTGQTGINPTGLTQVRLRYSLGDNDNGIENILKFYSGNYATVKHRPQLNVWYFLP